jgi:hypothetical protein
VGTVVAQRDSKVIASRIARMSRKQHETTDKPKFHFSIFMAAFDNQDNFMVQDASRLVDTIYRINRAQGRISNLIEKGEIPEGAGYNYNTTLYQRSNPTGGTGWQTIAQENGTFNNNVMTPGTTSPAISLISWNAEGRQERSNSIGFEDLRRAYNVREQLDAQHENFGRVITDIWEDRDNLAFFTAAGYKVIANTSLSQNYNSAVMPLTTPSTRAVQGILDILYERLSVDGAAEEPYAMADGQPLIPAIMSMAQHRNIIKEDPSVRQDFQWADSGKGMEATLMKGWGADTKAYGGYQHIVNVRQPRYDWTGSAWVQRAFYTTTTSGINLGTAAVVNPDYTNAAYEDIYLWHKKVVKRNMPNPGSSYGAGTSFDPVKWNGAVVWVNVKNTDITSAEYNPLGNRGRYYAALQAGYQVIKPSYGYAIRIQRCPKFSSSSCY